MGETLQLSRDIAHDRARELRDVVEKIARATVSCVAIGSAPADLFTATAKTLTGLVSTRKVVLSVLRVAEIDPERPAISYRELDEQALKHDLG